MLYNHSPLLIHYGVPGMKWGVRRNKGKSFSNTKLSDLSYKQIQKGKKFVSKHIQDIKLSKKEYRHVISELMTHSTNDQRAKDTYKKNIGKYTYTVRNRQGDVPLILDKKKINSTIHDKRGGRK